MTGLSNSFSYKPKTQTGWNYFQKQTHSKRDNTPISYFYFESIQKILLVLDVLLFTSSYKIQILMTPDLTPVPPT